MPPKKRKASEPTSALESMTRVTRSSTKGLALNVQAPAKSSNADSESEAPKPTRRKKVTRNASNSVVVSSTKKDTVQAKDEPPANVASIQSITSDLVKNPIECHNYTASSNNNMNTSLIFTHGAGGTLSAPAVVNFCTGFSTTLPVLAFQGSMNLKSRAKGFSACIEQRRKKNRNENLVLGGRSMGARAAVIAATEDEEKTVVGLVLASYPLKGPKDDVRDQILLDLPGSVKVLFICGDRDAMCPLDMLNEVTSKMKAKSQLVIMRGADHGMHVKPASLEKEYGEQTGKIAAEWVAGGIKEKVTYIGEEP